MEVHSIHSRREARQGCRRSELPFQAVMRLLPFHTSAYLPIRTRGMEWVLERCYSMNMKRAMLALLALSSVLQAGGNGSRVLYVGGTVAGVPMKSDDRLELSQDEV